MNKRRIYVASITLEIEGSGNFETLRKTGLFGEIEQAAYFQTYERDNLWIYRVEPNGRTETAVIKRVEGEAGKYLPMVEFPCYSLLKNINLTLTFPGTWAIVIM